MMRRHATWLPRSATFILRFSSENWRFSQKASYAVLRTRCGPFGIPQLLHPPPLCAASIGSALSGRWRDLCKSLPPMSKIVRRFRNTAVSPCRPTAFDARIISNRLFPRQARDVTGISPAKLFVDGEDFLRVSGHGVRLELSDRLENW